jgi:tRNA (cmo5U34)-methyltransferase
MSVAGHLSIQVEEYDSRIRTFVPHYEHMIAVAADALRLLDVTEPTIVDLGIGTGALAARCIEARPNARLIGIDSDPAMLAMARARLAGDPHVELRVGNFLREQLPPCDAIVACIALHHVPTGEAKRVLYTECARALKSGGLLVSADCFPAKDERLAARQHAQWLAHLEQFYSPSEAVAYLESWADEDTYFPLEDELGWMKDAGLQPEVLWRAQGFAVIAARRKAP